MKKLVIIFIGSLLICLPSFGQISVNERVKSEKKVKSELIGVFRSMGTNYVECNKYPNKEGEDYYSFTFKKAESSDMVDMQSFGFYDIDNAFENFSTMCLDGFENLPQDNYFSINLPDGELMVKYLQSPYALGMYFVYTPENGVSSKTHLMTKNKARKLFGQTFTNLLDNFIEKDKQFREEK